MSDIKFQDGDDAWSDLGLRGPWTIRQKFVLKMIALLAVAIVATAITVALRA